MARMANSPDEVDIAFRCGVIGQLVRFVDCNEDLKTTYQQFFSNITANAKHKHLAFHLFCMVSLYISKKTTLDEQQMAVITRTVGQLKREWVDESALALNTGAPHTGVVRQKWTTSYRMAAPSPTKSEIAAISAVRNNVGGDVNSPPKILEANGSGCSATPNGFVRETGKHPLKTPNFHEVIEPEGAASLQSQYPFGYKVMSKQGWSNQNGLGPDLSGIQRPLSARASARWIGDNDSPVGLAFPAAKANDKGNSHGSSAKRDAKQSDPFLTTATPRNPFSADLLTGDKSTRKVYRGDAVIDSALQRSRAAREVTTPTHGARTAQEQNGIEDDCKNTSKQKDILHQENISPRPIAEKSPRVPAERTGDFVPCTGGSGGW